MNLKNNTITINSGASNESKTYQKGNKSKAQSQTTLQSAKNTESIKAVDKLGKEIICPNCNTGNIVSRQGQYGKFWSCNNYPTCKSSFKDLKGKPQFVKGVK